MSPAVRQTLAPLRAPCGGLEVRVNGTACVLRGSGALWLADQATLIAADLHLEKGSAFAARGQMLPPYDSAATLDRLAAEIGALAPRRVVLLGDSFHDRRAIGRMAPGDRARLDLLAEGRDWVWLEGNHDREALNAASLPGRIAGAMVLAGLSLTHEPESAPAPGEVAGHLHPCATVVSHGRGVRRPCFLTDGRRLLLPAFGAFTGGLNVRDPAIADLFPQPPLAGLLGRDTVHPVVWSRLR